MRFQPDKRLRGYQVRALDEIARQSDQAGRRSFLLEMATDTGKTLIWAALIRHFLATRNAARFDLRYSEQQWVTATVRLIADDPRACAFPPRRHEALRREAAVHSMLGGPNKLVEFKRRSEVFEAMRVSAMAQMSRMGA